MSISKKDILAQLYREILPLQGIKPRRIGAIDADLGPVTAAFPNGVFPTGAIHEFLTFGHQNAATAGGFVAGIAASLMASGGACIWISAGRRVFPPGLVSFGIKPDRVVFIDLRNEREVMWALEESLKGQGLAAVVGETREISQTASRRLQLAVEKSQVTGFVLRNDPRNRNPIICAARWLISALPSQVPVAGMPGLGYPRWTVELQKIRNAQPGIWQLEWSAGRFQAIVPNIPQLQKGLQLKTG